MDVEKNQGFISYIILIIVALGLLNYFFDWSIFEFLSSDKGQGTVSYLRDVISTGWSYISAPVTFIWEEIIWPVLQFSWRSFQLMIEEFGKNSNSNS
jgi:hypothetical protein